MHSIRTKTTLLNAIAIVIAVIVATFISAFTIANMGHNDSEKNLNLLCETGKNNLNYYFKSVSQSIDTVSSIIQDDLEKTQEADFGDHMRRSLGWFTETTKHTYGALTFYYRIDPHISDNYTDPDAPGFYWVKDINDEHDHDEDKDEYYDFGATPISLEEDGTCKWFWDLAPTKNQDRKAVWLDPYITDRYEQNVISYNTPIYRNDVFYGVAGMEISYHAIGEQLREITLMKNGYAYVVIGKGNDKGKLVYHPRTNVESENPDDWPSNTPKSVIAEIDKVNYDGKPLHFSYKYNGVKKHASMLKLSNDMVIIVCVPLSEVNSSWVRLIIQISVISLAILVAFVLITVLYSRHITKPLRDLTIAAEEIDKGNYKAKIEYKGNDEIGTLAATVNKLIEHLDGYISDLNMLAYADALTDVRSKSAFDIFEREMQSRIDDPNDTPEFAIGFFDCDDLKDINDHYGHDKGDMYLKNSCHLICRVFQKSPIFRIGGDEFIVVLMGEDYQRREKLKAQFIEKSAEICSFAKEPWEHICVAVGIAVYNASIDKHVEDVLVRADHLMYENKRERKSKK